MISNHASNMTGCAPAIARVPYEEGTYWRKGTKHGPAAIVDCLKTVRRESTLGFSLNVSFEELLVADITPSPYQKETGLAIVEDAVAQILRSGRAPFLIGGDHSITLPSLRAISSAHGIDCCVLHFDAHSDTFPDIDGYAYHHGAGFRHAIQEGRIAASNLIQVGVRGFVRGGAMDFARESGVRVVSVDEFRSRGCNLDQFNLDRTKLYYISIDIDAVDPAYAPGTGTPVPGGFTSAEILSIVRQMAGLRIIGCDLVEVAPIYDSSNITVLLASHLVMTALTSWSFFGI